MVQPIFDSSWNAFWEQENSQEYFETLRQFVAQELHSGRKVYPPREEIFAAMQYCPLNQTKVVIIGQDPYHGAGQAHGLCFSVRKGVRIPPSLQNIYQELQGDLGITPPQHGDLSTWAKQGILLLNATLTVRAGQPTSHAGKGWEVFTDRAIQEVNNNCDHVVFLLWGRYAQQKATLIDHKRHCILTAAHPSPFSARNGFFGCRHFSQANAYLAEHGRTPIDWHLPQ